MTDNDRLLEIIDDLEYIHGKYKKWNHQPYDDLFGESINELKEVADVEEESYCFDCEETTTHRYNPDGKYCIDCTGDSSDQKREVEIDGDTWVAVKFNNKYRLFKEEWPDDAGVYLPSERGLCSHCLAENRISENNPSLLVCDECGGEETIVCSERETISYVRTEMRDVIDE